MRVIQFAILFTLLFTACNSSSSENNGDSADERTTNLTSETEDISSEVEKVDFRAFLLDNITIGMYDNPNGSLVTEIKNNPEDEGNYYDITVTERNGNWYHINTNTEQIGWVKQDAPFLGVYSAKYDGSNLVFHEAADAGSTEVCAFSEQQTGVLKILDYNNDWVKVSTDVKGKTYIGWVLKSNTCSAKLTTCS